MNKKSVCNFIRFNLFTNIFLSSWLPVFWRIVLTNCWIFSHLNREILLVWVMYVVFVHCKCCLHLSTPHLSRGYQISVLQISSKCTKVIWKWPWSGKDVLLPCRSKLPSRLAAGGFSNSFEKRWKSTTFSKDYHCFVWLFLTVNLLYTPEFWTKSCFMLYCRWDHGAW